MKRMNLSAAKVYSRFMSFIVGMQDKVTQDALDNLQKSLEYCMEENRVLKEQLLQATGKKRIILNDSQRRRFAVKGIMLGKHILKNVMTMFQPETIIRWHRQLVAKKYKCSEAGSSEKRKYRTVTPEKVNMVLRIVKDNHSWGYDRIAGYMNYLGLEISRSTVKRILDSHGLTPNPEWKKSLTWKKFLKSHWNVLSATDFLSVEILTPFGLHRCMILFFIDICTRKVELGGVKINPNGEWMKQVARNQTDCFDGFLNGKKYLICDRDKLYTKEFCNILKSSGVTVKRTPSFNPLANIYSEVFVKCIKYECLNKMIFLSESQVRYAAESFVAYYNKERPHLGIGGKMIEPHEQPPDGKIIKFKRLGGLLNSYRRVDETFEDAA